MQSAGVDFFRLYKSIKTEHKGNGGMKKTIWQKIDRTIGRLKLFRNTATIIKNRVTTDIYAGTTTVETESMTIRCPEPTRVRENLIDNTLVYGGDLALTLDYLTLKKEAAKAFPNQGWSESSAIFEPGKDEVEFAGVTYAVRSVIPEDWKDNQPGQYQVILKGIAPEGTEEPEESEEPKDEEGKQDEIQAE